MQITKIAFASMLACSALPQLAAAKSADEGYYVTGRVIDAVHKAANMDASARPGIGQFVPGEERKEFATGAVGVGYTFSNGWRTEGEYTFRRNNTFTSGSSTFATSFNVNDIESQRLMLNVYRDFAIADGWSVYGNGGIGLVHVKSGGWQGNESRRYIDTTRTQLAWALGAGVSYAPIDRLTMDLGYRYVSMGTAESGWNAFPNARGLQDEKLSLDLTSREIYLGARYAF
ncbi:outer membrane protein [Stenotrophomonas indicatrix]|uniref:outer membrane protein n=1 Tax=Stenotrophomonas indicatrix TaxID=2045451 RepID=UPI0015DED1DA|nr:outer membrane protein [Stenotrophomonas indicatrix]MBA0098765.1 porin family protein [Stenotrophomonas indicatrix]